MWNKIADTDIQPTNLLQACHSLLFDEDTFMKNSKDGGYDRLKILSSISSIAPPVVLGPAGLPGNLTVNASMSAVAKGLSKTEVGGGNDPVYQIGGIKVQKRDYDTEVKKLLYRAALSQAVLKCSTKKYLDRFEAEGLFDNVISYVPTVVKVARIVNSTVSGDDLSLAPYVTGSIPKEKATTEGSVEYSAPNGLELGVDPSLSHDAIRNIITSSTKNPGLADHWDNLRQGGLQRLGGAKVSGCLPVNFIEAHQAVSDGSPLTDSEQIIESGRALAGELLLCTLAQANPAQLDSLDEEGFFKDTTAALREILGKT